MKDEASIWVNQTNGCVEFICDNETGAYARSNCNESVRTMCFNNKCVNENEIDGKYIVIVEFNEALYLDLDEVVHTILRVTDVDIDKVNVAIEYNDYGSVFEVFIFTQDQQTRNQIIESSKKSSLIRVVSVEERPKASELVLSKANQSFVPVFLKSK